METTGDIVLNYQSFAQSFLITFLLCYAIHMFSFYSIFQKAGIRGKKALIPFYSIFLRFRLCWNTIWFWVNLAALIILFIGLEFNMPSVIISISFLLCVGIEMILQFRVGRSFGWKVIPSILLILFNPILLPILAFFSKSYNNPHKNC